MRRRKLSGFGKTGFKWTTISSEDVFLEIGSEAERDQRELHKQTSFHQTVSLSDMLSSSNHSDISESAQADGPSLSAKLKTLLDVERQQDDDNCIVLDNIPFDMTEDDIRDLTEYSIRRVNVSRDKVTGKSHGKAYLTLLLPEEGDDYLEVVNRHRIGYHVITAYYKKSRSAGVR